MREIFLSVPSLFCRAAVLLNYRINDVVNSSMKPEFSTNRDSYYEGKIVHIVWAFLAFLCIAPIFIRGRRCNIISFIFKWKDVSHKLKKKKSTSALRLGSHSWNNCAPCDSWSLPSWVSLSASNLSELCAPHPSTQLSEFTLYSSMSSAWRVKGRNLVERIPGISGHNGISELITVMWAFPSVWS